MKRTRTTKSHLTLLASLLLIASSLCAPACEGTGGKSPSNSSETNFLRRCSAESACGESFSCLCGACTQTCEQTSQCSAFAEGSECFPVGLRDSNPKCPESAVIAFCDVACERDSNCAELGDRYRCDRGFCRALDADCTTGETPGSSVVVLGDAGVANTHEIPAFLAELAREAGALGEDESYRDYSDPLDNHIGGDDPGLARQYAAAREDGPVSLVVMEGGAGDLVTDGCPDPISPDCPTIQEAVAGASALWDQMRLDGVEQVVFFFYPDNQFDEVLKEMLDTLRPLLEDACDSAPLPCHFLDLRPTFEGNYDEYVVEGEFTQTEAGARATAQSIWGVMQEHCAAQ